jgi:hypothetical protein
MLLLLALGIALASRADPQRDRPCLTVARAARAPIIDGRISPGEWEGAAALGGLLALGAQSVAQPRTTAFVTYDDSALYVAVRCDETDKTYPRGLVRGHDDRAFEDDCVQVFVAPEDLRHAKQASINFGGYQGSYNTWFADIAAYYEFTVNCQGSTTEARNDVRDWDVPWSSRVSRDEAGWSAEIAVPFASLGLQGPPEGSLWGFNIFRSRPPDASGWEGSWFGGYTPLSLGAVLFAGNHPTARQAAVSPAQPGSNRLTFSIVNPTEKEIKADLLVAPPGGAPVGASATVAAHAVGELSADYVLAGEGSLRAQYEVKIAGEDIPLLSGFVPLYVPPKYDLDLHYYSVPARVEGRVHLGPGAKATRAVLTLQPQGGPAETKEVAFSPSGGAVLTLPVVGKPGDKGSAALQILDAAGTPLVERKLDFAVAPRPSWLGTKAGLPLGVLPPWTPVQVRGKTVAMLGKRLAFADLALPAQIDSAGAGILAAPIRVAVSASGKEVAWRPTSWRVAEQALDHVKIESEGAAGNLALRVTSTIEYDGFSWNEVTLAPKGRATVDRVALEIPLRKDACRYVYEGHAQAAHALSPLGLRRPMGDNLWVGDEERGLGFLAESLEWVQSRDRARQLEIVPRGSGWLWRSTFIDTPTELTAPYTARFALHVTPAKPVSLRKSRIFHGAYYGLDTAPTTASMTVPARGHLDLARGTLEFWAKPTFDPEEAYDPKLDRSVYNRQFFNVSTDANDTLILYYNADDRSFRAVTRNAAGQYPVVLAGGAKLPKGQWSYVALSWGEKMRLSVNGRVTEADLKPPLTGSINRSSLNFALTAFDVDEIRISNAPRPIDSVPVAPFTADDQTLLLDPCEAAGPTDRPIEGRFGHGRGGSGELEIDRLAREGKRIVIFHENWSRFQGYPDLEQVPKLRKLADACHARGMIFLIYFSQSMSNAAPEWAGMRDDLLVLPESYNYHRDDVVQDCYTGCVNGPYGDLLLDGIAKLADQAGIDGVYMDGTTVPWICGNPSHPGCGEYLADGTCRPHVTLRGTRQFMKRLRSIFAQRRKVFFLDAHTGGCINIATQSFCDGYFDGETLARYKPGFRLSPDTFLTGYMGKQFGFRGDFLPNRHTTDQALAISLIHDTAMRGQPAEVDLAWGTYEDAATRFIPYWARSSLYAVNPASILGSLYLKRERVLLVLGSQTEQAEMCQVDVSPALRSLPAGVTARDAITGEALPMDAGKIVLPIEGRGWRMIEVRK